MRIMLGNVLFAAMVAGWYRWVGGNLTVVVPGTVLALAAFVTGACVGSWLNTPNRRPGRHRRHVSAPSLTDVAAFDHIQ